MDCFRFFSVREKQEMKEHYVLRGNRESIVLYSSREILYVASEEPFMERVCKFLKDAGTYCLATVEDDQPRVCPLGNATIFASFTAAREVIQF